MHRALGSFLLVSILSGAVSAQSELRLLEYGEDAALRERLIVVAEVHADLGRYLVAHVRSEVVAGLGCRSLRLAEPRSGEVLAAISDRSSPRALRGVRVLVDAGRLRIVAGPESRVRELRVPGVVQGGVQVVDLTGRYRLGRWVEQRNGPLGADPRIATMIGKIDKARLRSHIQTLSNLHTRNARTTYNAQAVQYLQAELAKLAGVSVKVESFRSGYGPNVIAEIRGHEIPDEIVMVGAHFDSYAGSSGNRSPGADDNASGTATVLELARVCSVTPMTKTLRFGFWNAEEYGLYGSGAYASAARTRGDKILAYLNTDMNAYRAPGDSVDVDFVLNDSTPSLVQTLTAISQLYVPSLGVKQGYLSGGTSDHRSFFRNGFPAVFYFEDLDRYSPYIHSSSDDLVNSAIDLDLSTLISRSVAAGLATLAEPLDVPQFQLSTAQGPSVGGTRVTVTGSALASVTEIRVAGRKVAFDTTNGLQFVTPVAAALGAAKVEVFNPAGRGEASFTYVATSPPALRVESPVPIGGASAIAVGGPAQGFSVLFFSPLQGATDLGLVQLEIGAGQLPLLVLVHIGGLSPGAGTLELPFPIPTIPSLRGQKFWLQAALLDAGLANVYRTNAAPLQLQ